MSGITIPLAEIAGGRAASPRVIDPELSSAVAQFGQRVAQIGDAMETDRLDREMIAARSGMNRDLGQLRQELAAGGDPDGIDRGWTERSAELRQQYIGQADPRNQARLGLAFDELADQNALALGARALDLRQSQRRALLDDQAYTYVSGAAAADPETRGKAYGQLADSVAEAMHAGTISPEAGAQILRNARDDGERAALTGRLASDPDGALTDLEKGTYAGLDPLYVEGAKVQAKAAISAREAAAAKAAEQAADKAQREIGDRLDVVIGNARDGRVTTEEAALLADPEVQENPKFAEAKAAVDLRNAMPQFALLSPRDQAAMIASEKAKTVGTRYDARVLEQMQASAGENAAAWAKDPIGRAQAVLPAKPAELPDPANAAPADLATALAARRGYATDLARQGYTDAPVYFSAAERASLAAAAGTSADPARRTALAGAFVTAFGRDAPRALREIGADPVFAHMGGLVAAGGNPNFAAEAFRGQQALAAKVVQPLKPELQRAAVQETLGDLVDQPDEQASIVQAADALYAARARGVDPDSNEGQQLYTQALQEALGAGVKGRNQAQSGGVQKVRSAPVILPIGITSAEVETGLGVAAAMFGTDGADPQAPWRVTSASTASLSSGTLPKLVGSAFAASRARASSCSSSRCGRVPSVT